MSQNNDLKKTPLCEKHIELGARMVPFSGWFMPVQYTSIIEEHMHTRRKAGIFDIHHMGEFFITGPKAGEDVARLVTCRTDDMPIGKCRYGFMLKDDGGIFDDLIVFKIAQDEYMLVVNAGTIEKEKSTNWVKSHLSKETSFEDRSEKIAKIDVQGPLSKDVLKNFVPTDFIENIKKYYFDFTAIEGVRTLISRTGYTGELGYELFFPAEHAGKIWDALMAKDGVRPIGLGARDTLRLEMGYCLYGHDIDEKHTPLEANLKRFVYKEKDFIGKEGLRKRCADKILTGFICEGRRSAREHFKVILGQRDLGVVTSSTFSPCLKQGIGLCYADINFHKEGEEVVLTDGKIEIKAKLKNIPLYKKD